MDVEDYSCALFGQEEKLKAKSRSSCDVDVEKFPYLGTNFKKLRC